ncbi:MAG: GrpB family protein [Acidimicrobiales bacterium]|jgi:GrpB-like predicted nucleotidyltransferase (UPF0157 family)
MDPYPTRLDDDYLDTVLIGGREEREVLLVAYDPAWPNLYEEHRGRILNAVGDLARLVEHIESTAVPGLAAKPIIDIMVTVEDPDDESRYLAPLEDAGYVLRVREDGHRMLRTPKRDVHVHVWQVGSDDERRHLAFRDHLRSHPADREAYEALKASLSGPWRDVNYYAEAKGPFIEQVIERASRQLPD